MDVRVAIVGSRDYPQLARVARFVTQLAGKHPDAVVISGGARGVDTAAEDAARAAGLSVVSYRPVRGLPPGVTPHHYRPDVRDQLASSGYRVDKHEFAPGMAGPTVTEGWAGPFTSFRDAAFTRNDDIVSDADVVVAFWNGASRGTANSISTAKRKGKRVLIYGVDGALVEDHIPVGRREYV